MTSK
jgi:hypothetical protein